MTQFLRQPSKINTQRLPLFISLILLVIPLILINFLFVQETLQIQRTNTVLRENPASDSKAVYSLKDQEVVQVLKEDHQWLLIRTLDHQQGWLAKWYLNNESLQADSPLKAKVRQTTPFYQKASQDSQVLGEFETGQILDLNQESLGWSRVQYDNAYVFVPTNQLEILSEEQVQSQMPDQDQEPMSEKEIVKVRVANQGAFDQPSSYGQVIYNPSLQEEFEFISDEIDVDGNEWYLVKNSAGVQMYIEARISAFVSDSKNHSTDTPARALKDATIVIDPGHGGEDVGALNSDVIFEKDFNLNTSLGLKDALEKAGAKVTMTRESDQWVDLAERSAISNQTDADIFLSIHYDASSDPSWNGTTTYYFHEADYDLAVAMNTELKGLPLANVGASFGNYQVIRENHHPALLLELGYLSNAEDLRTVQQKDFNDKVYQAIINGLDNYLKLRQP